MPSLGFFCEARALHTLYFYSGTCLRDSLGDAHWNANADFSGVLAGLPDNKIDVKDVSIVANASEHRGTSISSVDKAGRQKENRNVDRLSADFEFSFRTLCYHSSVTWKTFSSRLDDGIRNL